MFFSPALSRRPAKMYRAPFVMRELPNLNPRPRGRYGLLLVPAFCFGMAYWQVHRKKWKELLIASYKEKVDAAPITLPKDLSEAALMEYQSVFVRGEFDHSREIYLQNRVLHNEAISRSRYASFAPKSPGFHVITPFKMDGRQAEILVDRGWVSKAMVRPELRRAGQIEGPVDVEGVVRLSEKPHSVMRRDHDLAPVFRYRDIDAMAQYLDCCPLLVELKASSNVPGGPIGGQTVVHLRNHHLEYILTWSVLGSIFVVMWLIKFGKRPDLGLKVIEDFIHARQASNKSSK